MIVRLMLGGPQPPDSVSVSAQMLLIVLILIVVAIAGYRDPKLATAIGAAGAIGALLVRILAT